MQNHTNQSIFYPRGIDNPSFTWVTSICSLCAGTVYIVLRGSPTDSISLVSSLRKIHSSRLMARVRISIFSEEEGMMQCSYGR